MSKSNDEVEKIRYLMRYIGLYSYNIFIFVRFNDLENSHPQSVKL